MKQTLSILPFNRSENRRGNATTCFAHPLRKFRHYVTDYQGNNTAVVSDSGAILEQTGYFPYGEPFREPSHPYTFSDNERLHAGGQNQYDFHARRLIPTLLRFDCPDPLMEKKPWNSPYLCFAGNPVMMVDPDGRTEYYIGISGLVVDVVESDEDDVCYFLNNAGEIMKGSEIYFKGHPVKVAENRDGYTLITVSGDDNGRELFEKLASDNDNEFSATFTGSGNGDEDELVHITSSQGKNSEGGFWKFFSKELLNKAIIRASVHNHPSNNDIPGPSDLIVAYDAMRLSGQLIEFYLYTSLDKAKYTMYSPESFPIYDSIYKNDNIISNDIDKKIYERARRNYYGK